MTLAAEDARRAGAARFPAAADAVPLGEAAGDLPAWTDLAAAAVERSVFVEPAMLAAAAGTIEPDDWETVRVHGDRGLDALLTVRAGRAAPLVGPRVVDAFRSHYGPRTPPLLRPGRPDAADRLAEALAARGGVVRLGCQALEAPAIGLLVRAAERRGGAAVTVDVHHRALLLADRPVDEAVGPALEGRRLRELDRLMRRLGAVEHRRDVEAGPVGAALEAFIALEALGWKGARGSALAADGRRLAFARRFVHALAAEGRVRADSLLVDGRTAAVVLTLMAGDTGFFWKIAHDPALARFSPGVQVARLATMAHLADPAVRRVDSLATGDHPLMDRLWRGRLAVGTVFLALGPGHVAAARRAAAAHVRYGEIRASLLAAARRLIRPR